MAFLSTIFSWVSLVLCSILVGLMGAEWWNSYVATAAGWAPVTSLQATGLLLPFFSGFCVVVAVNSETPASLKDFGKEMPVWAAVWTATGFVLMLYLSVRAAAWILG